MASVVHPTEKIGGSPAIVLAVQQFGKGRTGAFAADTTWRWSLFLRALQKDSPYNRFWGQMIRWLASEEDLEKKSGASITAMMGKERYEAGESVMLKAAATDQQGQSTNFANVWADITGPDGKTVRVPLAAAGEADGGGGGGGQTGMYQETYLPAMAGTHKVVFGGMKDKVDLGHDESSFTVLAAAGERDVLAGQPQTLEAISRATGGASMELSGVGALADRLLATAAAPAGAASVRCLCRGRGRSFWGLWGVWRWSGCCGGGGSCSKQVVGKGCLKFILTAYNVFTHGLAGLSGPMPRQWRVSF